MKKKLFLVSAAVLLSQPAFALFCPNGFNQINYGDTPEQVQAECGKPDGIAEEKSDENVPQQWQYYPKPDPQAGSTVNLTVVFEKGKVANLAVNGTNLQTTPICGQRSVTVGDSFAKVKAACGTSAFITKGNVPPGTGETITTKYKYNGQPPVVLIFQDGKLTKRM